MSTKMKFLEGYQIAQRITSKSGELTCKMDGQEPQEAGQPKHRLSYTWEELVRASRPPLLDMKGSEQSQEDES